MKSIATLCAVAIAASSFSGIAAARDHRDDREERREARAERRAEREARREDRRWDRQRDHVVRVQPQTRYVYTQPRTTTYVYTQPRYTPNYHYQAPRYSYNYARPSYHIGGYVPSSYRQPYYYVNDWQTHGLYQPPYGHQWVRTDTGDFLLMALATGIIASLILNSR